MKTGRTILLGHGSGGKLTHELITEVFVKRFSNPTLEGLTDAAVLNTESSRLAFTTDAFVVDPIFFPGGNIGKLAVAGTVNDLAVSGAKPLYLSASFIIEEGFPVDDLITIVDAMAAEARDAGLQIVTGDTKVVQKGQCDKVFINTTGIGTFSVSRQPLPGKAGIQAGDKIIVSGTIGDHGMAVLAARNELPLKTTLTSDCACLNHLIDAALSESDAIRFMRDATRGGLGTVLAELCENSQWGIKLQEEAIPVAEEVRGMCELLGFDPLYVANEGKVVMVVSPNDTEKVLKSLRNHPLGADAAVIGEIVKEHPGLTWLHTTFGSTRIVDMLTGEQLPRIC